MKSRNIHRFFGHNMLPQNDLWRIPKAYRKSTLALMSRIGSQPIFLAAVDRTARMGRAGSHWQGDRLMNIRTTLTVTSALVLAASSAFAGNKIAKVLQGNDTNNDTNGFVQPQDAALSGGGRDQTLKFGDQLIASKKNHVLIGGLGVDTLIGDKGNDILIGGPEHFNPENRDRAFGGKGNDVFIWKPGDGSDFFAGGKGTDTVIFGLIGEDVGGVPTFGVSTDQQTAPVFLDEKNLPIVDVSNSPGFCKVIDSSTSQDAAAELEGLGIDHLVQFLIKAVNQSFEAGSQSSDNGLRVTLHLDSVEYLVCTKEDSAEIEAFDLRTAPPTPIAVEDLPKAVRRLIQ